MGTPKETIYSMKCLKIWDHLHECMITITDYWDVTSVERNLNLCGRLRDTVRYNLAHFNTQLEFGRTLFFALLTYSSLVFSQCVRVSAIEQNGCFPAHSGRGMGTVVCIYVLNSSSEYPPF